MQFLGLVVAAAVLRIVGSAARSFGGPAKHIDSRAALRTVGWLLCLTATWLATGAAGCWFPLWPALIGSVLAVLLGASIRDLNERGDYWYKHFHLYRRDQRTISHDLYEQLMARYYSAPASAAALDSDHVPLLFVRFGLEFDNIVDTREALYEMIPGNKDAWVLEGSTHHFSTYEVAGLMVGDSGISRRLAARLRLFADETIRHKAQAGSR